LKVLPSKIIWKTAWQRNFKGNQRQIKKFALTILNYLSLLKFKDRFQEREQLISNSDRKLVTAFHELGEFDELNANK
jgi:hypothetical protein